MEIDPNYSINQLQQSSVAGTQSQSKLGSSSVTGSDESRPPPPPPPPGGVEGAQGPQSGEVAEGSGPVPPFSMGQGIDSAEIQEEAASFKSFMDSLSDEEKEEIQDFIKETMDAILSGDFDADEVEAAMPDALEDYAEANGLDLLSRFEAIDNNNGELQSRISNNVYHFNGSLSSVSGNSPENEMISSLFKDQ